ncbi:hypothetical protein QR680_015953 [Steinernema hermaphroditum]|uniref:Uncharacterized protein n=1 Tax=Steinernema hermaphroditum TaxID=289476 RepID=A0AA39HBP4_9BILA|nr:hypothetical protein QR680_015953 [Steinernema hermaphroditum]
MSKAVVLVIFLFLCPIELDARPFYWTSDLLYNKFRRYNDFKPIVVYPVFEAPSNLYDDVIVESPKEDQALQEPILVIMKHPFSPVGLGK